jgi:chromosome segregation ATPase
MVANESAETKNVADNSKKQKEAVSEETKPTNQSGDVTEKPEFEPQPGKIFEESTKSISAMANEMSETARIVSSMKEGLVRVNKIADAIYNNPLDKTLANLSHKRNNFPNILPRSHEATRLFEDVKTVHSETEGDKVDEIIAQHAKDGLSDLKLDAESIRQDLRQFQSNIKQKESELIEFREKLHQARLQAKNEVGNPSCSVSSNGLLNDIPQGTDELQTSTEFETITTENRDATDFDSIQGKQSDNRSDIELEIKEGEKRLLELRWKIKKAETEYEKRKAENEEFADLSAQVQELESKRDLLEIEIKKLENQNKEPKQELRELEQKIQSAKKEYEEKLAAKQEIEDVRSVLDYLKLDKESLKSDLEELRMKIKNAEKEYQEKNAAKDELEDVRFNVTTLKAEKETILAELDQIRTKIAKSEAELEEKRAEKEKLGEFKAVLTHMKIEKEALGIELDELKAKIKKIESELLEKKRASEEMHEVREILAYLKPERDAVKAELNQLRDKIERLQDSYDEINSRKRELQLEYDDLKSRLRKLESEYDEKKNSFHFR